MSWVISILRRLTLSSSTKFLLIFSVISITTVGIVWACSFEDDSTFSIFSPEAFVAKEYTPFFLDNQYWYYGGNVEVEQNNNRFNTLIIKEWDAYLNHQLSEPVLGYILLHCSKGSIDSIHRYINGQIPILKVDSFQIDIASLNKGAGKLNKSKADKMFAYLDLAKECENFAVSADRGWYDERNPPAPVSSALEGSLLTAFNTSKDAFIGQRLLFQLSRYYFFNDDTAKSEKINSQDKILALYDKYKDAFPKNLIYYRTLGYVAGYYRSKGDYAQANYLYSRCYDFCFEMMIPSKFSFHPQQETDWLETLKLAKNKEEQITLWHMLGMEYDPTRAIKKIMALNSRSDKVDLLLSRLINGRESGGISNHRDSSQNADTRIKVDTDLRVIDSIALLNNTAKPYFWNIAAGYMYYMNNDYAKAAKFYAVAKKQLPANDTMATAQYKLLSVLLEITQLKHIDSKTEASLVEPLYWLHYPNSPYLRFEQAVAICKDSIAAKYMQQKDTLKALCFSDSASYANRTRVQQLIDLMNKPDKSAFEKVMLKYYPHTVDELYYNQAAQFTYDEDIDKAIDKMSKVARIGEQILPANPFNAGTKDCHDCDAAAPQKQKFNPLSFLTTIQNIKAELKAGNNISRNAWLLANAYYNITYYGNARTFYEADAFSGYSVHSQETALKYYLLSRRYAKTDEQKAKCTFMASKCEHNEFYDQFPVPDGDQTPRPEVEKYFGELKSQYAQTKYYREVLHECGYFRNFVHAK